MSEEDRNIGSSSLAISRYQPARLRTRCILPLLVPSATYGSFHIWQ